MIIITFAVIGRTWTNAPVRLNQRSGESIRIPDWNMAKWHSP